jgi:hypothetical protein
MYKLKEISLAMVTISYVDHIPSDTKLLPKGFVVCKQSDDLYLNQQFVGRYSDVKQNFGFVKYNKSDKD